MIWFAAVVFAAVYCGFAASAHVDGYADSMYAEPYPGRRKLTRWAYMTGWNAGTRKAGVRDGDRS